MRHGQAKSSGLRDRRIHGGTFHSIKGSPTRRDVACGIRAIGKQSGGDAYWREYAPTDNFAEVRQSVPIKSSQSQPQRTRNYSAHISPWALSLCTCLPTTET